MRFSKRDTTVRAPFVVAPTNEFDGSDGNWSTFAVEVGTPEPQTFRVSISTIANAIWIPQGPAACTARRGDPALPSDCPDIRGIELFDSRPSLGFRSNESDSWVRQGDYVLSLSSDLEDGSMPRVYGEQLYNISATYGTDNATLRGNSDSTLSMDGLAIAEYSELYDFTIGSLGLGLGSVFLGRDQIETFMTAANRTNKIPSLSWSYTAGAHYRDGGYAGSLILGGYDTTRFVENDVTFSLPPSTESTLLQVTVQGFTVIYRNGSTYNPNAVSSESSGTYDATLDSTTPFMYMPSDVVDALVDNLDLEYVSDSDIYVPRRGQLDTAIDRFEITLADTSVGDNVTSIRLPRDAFALDASFPYFENGSSQYFPIRKANNNHNLIGRVFFQEAYVSADFGRGNFSIKQASFPNPRRSPQVVAITAGDTDSGSSGLSGGAIAGIVIGVLAAVAIIAAGLAFLWLRKRKEQREREKQEAFEAAEEEKARQAAKERRETISTVLSQETAVSYEMDAHGMIAARPVHMRHISELSSDSENERVRKIVNSPDTVFELPDSSAWESNEQRMMNSPHVPSPMLSATEGEISEAPDNQSESAGVVSPTSPTPSQRVVNEGGIDRLAAPSEDGTHSPR